MNIVGWVTLGTTIAMAILTHIAFFIWWASKTTTTLDFVKESVDKLQRDQVLVATKEEVITQKAAADQQHKAMWQRLDEWRTKLEELEKEFIKLKSLNGGLRG